MLAVAAALPATASATRHVTALGGTPVDDSVRPAVGVLEGRHGLDVLGLARTGGLPCVAVLVADDLAVTGAFCQPTDLTRVQVRIGSTKVGDRSAGVVRTVQAVSFGPASDVTFLQLSSAITTIAPLPLHDAAPGDPVTAILLGTQDLDRTPYADEAATQIPSHAAPWSECVAFYGDLTGPEAGHACVAPDANVRFCGEWSGVIVDATGLVGMDNGYFGACNEGQPEEIGSAAGIRSDITDRLEQLTPALMVGASALGYLDTIGVDPFGFSRLAYAQLGSTGTAYRCVRADVPSGSVRWWGLPTLADATQGGATPRGLSALFTLMRGHTVAAGATYRPGATAVGSFAGCLVEGVHHAAYSVPTLIQRPDVAAPLIQWPGRPTRYRAGVVARVQIRDRAGRGGLSGIERYRLASSLERCVGRRCSLIDSRQLVLGPESILAIRANRLPPELREFFSVDGGNLAWVDFLAGRPTRETIPVRLAFRGSPRLFVRAPGVRLVLRTAVVATDGAGHVGRRSTVTEVN